MTPCRRFFVSKWYVHKYKQEENMSENIIQLKNISKTFVTDKGEFKALEDINLDIGRGSIWHNRYERRRKKYTRQMY